MGGIGSIITVPENILVSVASERSPHFSGSVEVGIGHIDPHDRFSVFAAELRNEFPLRRNAAVTGQVFKENRGRKVL